jgi:hypothetical protein
MCYFCNVKNNNFHKIFLSLLAVLIVLSTTSFTIQKHFCGDFLIDSAVFSAVEKCSKEPCSNSDDSTNFTPPDCCNDVADVVQGQDVLITKSFDDLEYTQQVFLLAFSVSYINLFQPLSEYYIPHQYYSPPKLVTDTQVCHQVFLI